MFGVPVAVLALVAGLAAGASAPFLVHAYHRLCVYVYAKTGVQIPDSPTVDADIVAVAKALAPLIVSEAIGGKLDPAAIIAAVEGAVKAANPAADTSGVQAALAIVHPKFDAPGLR